MQQYERIEYRGKHYTIPVLSREGTRIDPARAVLKDNLAPDPLSPVLQKLNSLWDLSNFAIPRKPMRVALLSPQERELFSLRDRAPRTLDLPIKFPGSEFRVPREFEQFVPLIERVASFEWQHNQQCFDEYFCYLTVDQGEVQPGRLQREAPCHVDGFQGARWTPKTRINHSYVISDHVPTVYYPQPFDFSQLDESKHNFFWEMNRQVALTNSAHAWSPEPYELSLMDAYTVHRGDSATERVYRTWVRMSFEVRVFDRLGNAHNPMFKYDWAMVPRDIEGLNLVAWDQSSDPSLRVFPWQNTDGTKFEDRAQRTQPKLRREP
jgi:hypothetical protein